MINSLPLPPGTEDSFIVTLHFDSASEPFRHGELVAKLVVVDDSPLLDFHDSLTEYFALGKHHLMGSASSQFRHFISSFEVSAAFFRS